MLINAAESCLIVVDIQERLCPVIDDPRTILYNATRLLRGAALLDVPALITEHCPQSIGPTMIDLREEFSPDQVVTKTAFSAAAEPAVRDRVAALGRRQLILCGTEAHVCVLQTALGFRALGYDVFVATDASGSRRPADREAGLARMVSQGCQAVTTEMVLFEWLGRADHPRFRDILQRLIK
ncbi:hydrolase [Novispirillum itersonii]|uniref:hydrolase n=1 Tax=Novispirillum itersonii TaxID=189 RepID=UPI000363646F|nr:hydrolase [Novispirillum itersonii]